MKKKLSLLVYTVFIICALPTLGYGQKSIELTYDAQNNTLNRKNIPQKLKDGVTYNIVLNGVNSAYILPYTEVTASKYISDVPDILRSLYVGIPDNAVGMNFPQNATLKPEFYLQATKYYRDLSNIKRITDDLYLQTRFQPKTEVAEAKKQELFQALGVRSIQEAYDQAVRAKKYIEGALAIYNFQIANKEVQSSDTSNFLEEYTTLSGYNENVGAIDYAYLLNFMEASQQASPEITIAQIIASDDVIDLDL
ncbi:MAG: hypothetical protein WA951_15050, partial [Leeuwenhoekiella sp.]